MKQILLFPLNIALTVIACFSFLSKRKTKTRKPVSDVPVKSKRFNRDVQVEIFKLESLIIDGDLGLFKNNALIAIEIQGKIIDANGEQVFLDEITLMEYATRKQNSDTDHTITVELIPSFTYKKNNKDKSLYAVDSSCMHFKTRIEHRLYTCGFGKNVVTFAMGDEKSSVTLYQGK